MPLKPNQNNQDSSKNKYIQEQMMRPHSHRRSSQYLTRLQAWARPLGKRLHRLKLRLDEGAVLRKRITVLTLIALIVISLTAGKLMSPPEQIVSTSIGTKKEFLSGDTIAPQKTTYDTGNHTARIDLEATSPTGIMSPQDLYINYKTLKKAKNSLPAPKVYLVPTVNNHYIVIIRNLYHGFQALELQFHDNSKPPLAQYQNALSHGSNGASDNSLDNQSMGSLESDQHVGGLYLPNKDKSVLLSSSSSVQNKQKSLLNKINSKNSQIIVLKEHTLLSNHGNIPTTLSPKDISTHDIDTKVQSLKSQINSENNNIKQHRILLSKMKKHSGTLSKDATVDKDYKHEINNLNQNITNTQSSIQQSQNTIGKYHKQIQNYQDQLNQFKNNRINFDTPAVQSNDKFHSR